MCRLAGFYSFNDLNYDKSGVVTAMRETMTHGGPDGFGQHDERLVSLGHRRLSILDLSESGAQPMTKHGRTIVHNGEIYNFRAIRTMLEKQGCHFESNTDTEVILEAIQEYGIMKAINLLKGMFAFAIWDEHTSELTIVRDRIGIKPMYYVQNTDFFSFASELKAIETIPNLNLTIDHHAVSIFLHKGFIPSPMCIYKEVRKLPQACLLVISSDGKVKIDKYWSPRSDLVSETDPIKSEEHLLEVLEDRLTRSFIQRTVSDVPIGVFLSGGVDSSLLATLLSRKTGNPVNTFTLGFEEKELDESLSTRKFAKHIGSNHKEKIMRMPDFEEYLPTYFQTFDEPFGDSSGLATYILAEFAGEDVKVCLSGDGADELFGGYAKYKAALAFEKLRKFSTSGMRKVTAKTLNLVPADLIFSFLPSTWSKNRKNRYLKLLQALPAKDLEDFFERASGYNGHHLLHTPHPTPTPTPTPILSSPLFPLPSSLSLLPSLGLLDINTYVEGDILVKADRAGMAHGLEIRVPWLDYELLEWALTLPDHWKIRGNTNKYLLRKLLEKLHPNYSFNVPKQGFRLPIGKWIKQTLKTDLEAMRKDGQFLKVFQLNEEKCTLEINGFLNEEKRSSEYRIWFLLVLYKWWSERADRL